MEENLKEISINELKEKKYKLTEQLDAIYTELDERKRRDAIIAELFYNFNYMGSLNDIINIVDELNDLEINMFEQLLSKNRDLKHDLSKLQQDKTCKCSFNDLVGRPEEIRK